MSTDYVNQKASQALRGQAVLVTLNSADSANLYKVQQGQLATVGSNNKTGVVARVNIYGNSFLVNPIQPDRSFDSAPGTYGYLAASETITVNT